MNKRFLIDQFDNETDNQEPRGTRIGAILENVAYNAGYYIDGNSEVMTMELSKDIILRIASLEIFMESEEFGDVVRSISEDPNNGHRILDRLNFSGRYISENESRRLVEKSFAQEAEKYYRKERREIISSVREMLADLDADQGVILTDDFSTDVVATFGAKLNTLRNTILDDSDEEDDFDLSLADLRFNSQPDDVESTLVDDVTLDIRPKVLNNLGELSNLV